MSSLSERHEKERARWDADRAAHQRRIRVLNLITLTALTAVAFLHLLKWLTQ